MTFQLEEAKKAGYSDEEILDFLSKKHPSFDIKKAKDSGYSDKEIVTFLHEKSLPSKTRSALGAPIKGAIKGVQSLVQPLGNLQGAIPAKLGKRILEQTLPTREEHEPLERVGKLATFAAAGPEGLGLKIAQTGLGALGGEIAKQTGAGELGQAIAEAGGMGLAGLGKGLISSAKNVLKTTPKKLPSGLTEIKAVEAKAPRLGTISKERQAASIEKLNKEASELAKTSAQKHVPLIKDIEKGIDFETRFEKGFGDVERLAQKANPEIDITPLRTFFKENRIKYKDLPSPHIEGKKILAEVNNFNKNPQQNLGKLMRIYRSNNKKIRNSYERARLSGTQQEYVDFLVDQNKAIADSFRKTLPSDSSWVKLFDQTNKEFRDFQNAKKTINQLKGFLSETPTKAEVTKLATNTKAQDRLKLAMGEKGAEEVTQIAKDLKQSIEAIKKIPRSELSKYDAIFPLYFLIPWAGKAIGLYKASNLARYLYGWMLSTPARRKIYNEALKSVLKKDVTGYQKALLPVINELESEKD